MSMGTVAAGEPEPQNLHDRICELERINEIQARQISQQAMCISQIQVAAASILSNTGMQPIEWSDTIPSDIPAKIQL